MNRKFYFEILYFQSLYSLIGFLTNNRLSHHFGLFTFYDIVGLDVTYPLLTYQPIFDQCPTSAETRQLVFTSKMFKKHLWKSDTVSKDAVR